MQLGPLRRFLIDADHIDVDLHGDDDGHSALLNFFWWRTTFSIPTLSISYLALWLHH